MSSLACTGSTLHACAQQQLPHSSRDLSAQHSLMSIRQCACEHALAGASMHQGAFKLKAVSLVSKECNDWTCPFPGPSTLVSGYHLDESGRGHAIRCLSGLWDRGFKDACRLSCPGNPMPLWLGLDQALAGMNAGCIAEVPSRSLRLCRRSVT